MTRFTYVLFILLAGCERGTTDTPLKVSDSTSQAGPGPSASVSGLNRASVAVLEQALADKDYATRLTAIEALGHTKSDAVVPWLERALGDREADVRMAAVDALGRLHTVRALAVLATVRDDTAEQLDIRALAASSLL